MKKKKADIIERNNFKTWLLFLLFELSLFFYNRKKTLNLKKKYAKIKFLGNCHAIRIYLNLINIWSEIKCLTLFMLTLNLWLKNFLDAKTIQKKSSAMKIGENVHWRYSMSTIWAFDNIEINIVYIGGWGVEESLERLAKKVL